MYAINLQHQDQFSVNRCMGFGPPVCFYRLNWAKRSADGEMNHPEDCEMNDMTNDSKFGP